MRRISIDDGDEFSSLFISEETDEEFFDFINGLIDSYEDDKWQDYVRRFSLDEEDEEEEDMSDEAQLARHREEEEEEEEEERRTIFEKTNTGKVGFWKKFFSILGQ